MLYGEIGVVCHDVVMELVEHNDMVPLTQVTMCCLLCALP